MRRYKNSKPNSIPSPVRIGVMCLLCGLLAVNSVNAANVSLTASDAAGSDSWDEAGKWNLAQAPSAANDYFTAGFQLRTPNNLANNTTFGGRSLTLNKGSVLYKGSGNRIITINNLTLDGGAFVDGNSGTTVTLAGNGITVNTTGCFDSTTDSSDRNVVVTAAIGGTGIITNRGNGSVQLAPSSTSSFAGKWILQGNQTRIASDGALGQVPAGFTADSITMDRGVLVNRDTDVKIAANRGITLTTNGGRFEAGWSKDLEINSVITGPGAVTILTDSTPGVVAFNGINTYTGATVIQNNAWFQVNGSLSAASTVTVQAGGFLLGNGTINGMVTADANANVGPGGLFTPGTLTLNNAVALNSCSLHADVGDLLQVNGNLTVTGTITVIPQGFVAGTYTIISYTGALTGTAANFVAAPSRYTITFDTATAGQVKMVVAGGPPADLAWKGDNMLNLWDFSTPNWLNGGTPDVFQNGDNVLIDDTGAYFVPISVTTSFLLNTLVPGSVVVDADKDYTLTGGRLAGPMTLTKRGTGLLTITAGNVNLPNYFDGDVIVEEGIVKAGYPRAFGRTSGGVILKNGASLDVNAQNLGLEPVTVVGEGVGGLGAIINTAGGQNNCLHVVTLTGDATVGGTGRFDIRNSAGNASLSTGGNAYNLTKKGPNQFSLVGVAVDPALGDVNVLEGTFGFETTSTLGNPAKTLTMAPNTTLTLWNLVNEFYKPLVLGGGTAWAINNGSGSNSIVGPVTVNGDSILYANANHLAIYSGIQGTGGIVKGGNSNLFFYGKNTYSGTTTVTGGKLVLGTNASISNSPAILLGNGTTLDVSAISSAAGQFALNGAIGQTLSGGGTVIGNVVAGNGSVISPGASAGTLTINGNVSMTDGSRVVVELNSTTEVGGGTNDLIVINGNLDFSGTITVQINALAPLDIVKPYTIATYSGTLNIPAIINVPSDSRYTFAADVSVPNVIRVFATPIGMGADTLTWRGNVLGSETLWDVKTTANWLNSLLSADSFYVGDAVRFDDSAVGTTISLSSALSPASVVVANDMRELTWTGPGRLTGPATLTKEGSGKLTLANSGLNDHSGTTTISAGTLQVGDGGTVGTISPAVNNNANLVFNRSDNFTVSSVIGGTGQTEKRGAGVMTLSAAQTTTGPILVSQGTLRTANAAALGTVDSGTTIAPGATLDVNNQQLGNESITVSGSGVGSAGAIINTGGEQQNATRNVSLAGDTTFGGFGRWDIRDNGSTPSQLLGNGYNLTKVGINQIWFIGLEDINVNNITINEGTLGFETTSTMGLSTATLTVNPGASVGLYNNNNSAAPIDKVVVMNAANWLNNSGDNYFTGPVTLNGFNTFNTASGTTLRMLGAIGGSGSLVKANSGTLILGADNNYAGDTAVQAGILRIGNGGGTGTVLGTIYNSGRVDIERADQHTQAFAVVGTGGMGIRTPGLIWDSTGKIDLSGTVEVGRDVAGTLYIQGTADPKIGNLFLGNPAAIPGEVFQSGGTVIISNAVRVGHWSGETSTYNIENGTLTLVGTPSGPAASSSSGVEQNGILYVGVDGTGIFNQKGGSVTVHGLVMDNRGATTGDDTFNLDAGTLTIGPSGISCPNASTYSYLINLDAGTLRASADWSSNLRMTLTGVTGSPTFDTGPYNIYLSGTLSGAGGLMKTGSGALVILGANSYQGATLINQGTLKGNGTIAGPTTIPAGSAIAPGMGTTNGTLTFAYGTAPAITLAGTTEMKISKTGATLGNDKILALAGIQYGGTLTVLASGDALAGGDSFQLFESTAYSGTFAPINLPTLTGDLTWDTSTLATDGTIRVKSPQLPEIQYTITGEGAGRTLTISWQGNYVLQTQAHPIGQGINDAWVDVTGATSPYVVTPIPTDANVFFRLRQ